MSLYKINNYINQIFAGLREKHMLMEYTQTAQSARAHAYNYRCTCNAKL